VELPSVPAASAGPAGCSGALPPRARGVRVPQWGVGRRFSLAVVLAVTLLVVPRWLAGRDADAYFDGDLATQDPLARTVAGAVTQHPELLYYRTGSSRFDGQSAVAIYQMTLLGLGQILLSHPDKRGDYLPAMREAARRLASPAVLAYAAGVYGHNGVVQMGEGEGHAYLGYVNLGLGMIRLFDPDTPLAGLHDRLTRELARRLDASPQGLIETYPGETWPPDVAAVAGSIGLHGRATGTDHAALLARWAARFESCVVDPSGLVVQRTQTGSCKPLDAPRGSGTAIAAYFIGFAVPELSARLEKSLARRERTVLGFGGVREYAEGFDGKGDLNAGPMVLGMSVGATGFGLGAARMNGDRTMYRDLYRSTSLLGIPVATDGRTVFATGGVLGNALLLAMLTARAP
jgi:hypothetical protein